MAVASGRVTYTDLATVLSVEDMWNVIEIMLVDAHNRRVMAQRQAAEAAARR